MHVLSQPHGASEFQGALQPRAAHDHGDVGVVVVTVGVLSTCCTIAAPSAHSGRRTYVFHGAGEVVLKSPVTSKSLQRAAGACSTASIIVFKEALLIHVEGKARARETETETEREREREQH